MSRERKHPITDSFILAVVREAGGRYDAEGHYGEAVLGGLASRTEAQEYKQSLYRCAHYLARTGRSPVSISRADVGHIGALTARIYQITFRVSNKDRAREHQIEAHGADPNRWAYNPSGYDPRRYRGG